MIEHVWITGPDGEYCERCLLLRVYAERFGAECREPEPVAVRRIRVRLWGEDMMNVKAAIDAMPNGFTVVPKGKG